MNILSFISNFALPELKTLATNYRKIFFLLFIVSLAFGGLGFSNGINQYLKKRMDNPFVKFVNITIPDGFHHNSTMETLGDSKLQSVYHFNAPHLVFSSFQNFESNEKTSKNAKLMGVKENNMFLKYLLSNRNFFRDNRSNDITESQYKSGIILTKSFAEKTSYKKGDGYLNLVFNIGSNEIKFPIPVCGIVDQLPGQYKGLINEEFLAQIDGTVSSNYILDPSTYKIDPLIIFFPKRMINSTFLTTKTTWENKFNAKNLDNETIDQGERIEFLCSNSDSLFNSIQSQFPGCIRTYRTSDYVHIGITPDFPEFISIPFSHLDSVNSFQNFMETDPAFSSGNKKLRIDMNVIEAKNNFNFFNNLSSLLSKLLLLLGMILMISIVLNHVLNHMDKNKSNLGTLKAFGMSNLSIVTVYSSIAAILIIGITGISYGIASIFGSTLAQQILQLSGINIGSDDTIFKLSLDWIIGGFFILLPIFVIFISIYSKTRNKTPGDLIYGR